MCSCLDKQSNDIDAYNVDVATEHLIKLLEDPYYHEAFQRLQVSKHSAVAKRANTLSQTKGGLAHRLQNPERDGMHLEKKHGRPKMETPALQRLLSRIDEYNEKNEVKISLVEAGMRFGRELFPDHDEEELRAFAKRFGQIMRNERKKHKSLR